MSLTSTAYSKLLAELDSLQLKDAALAGLTTLYKIRMTLMAGLQECKTDEDWLLVANMVNKQISECHIKVDEILGLVDAPVEPTPTEDHDRQEWANVYAQNELS